MSDAWILWVCELIASWHSCLLEAKSASKTNRNYSYDEVKRKTWNFLELHDYDCNSHGGIILERLANTKSISNIYGSMNLIQWDRVIEARRLCWWYVPCVLIISWLSLVCIVIGKQGQVLDKLLKREPGQGRLHANVMIAFLCFWRLKFKARVGRNIGQHSASFAVCSWSHDEEMRLLAGHSA
jgi:hypothetical protein